MTESLTDCGGTRGVFFDLVGTLIRARAGIGEQYAYWARRHGAGAADPERLGTAFARAMRESRPMAFPGAGVEEASKEERRWWHGLVRRVVSDAGLSEALGQEGRFDRFFDDLFEHFTSADAWVAYADAPPTLAALRDRGIQIGLITNYDTRVYSVLDALGLSPLIDSVTIPALVGAAKPDAAIFHHALRHHGLPASAAVYVGDEVEDDYLGAEGAGMKAILIDRDGRHEREQGLTRIRSLEDLPAVTRR